MRRKEFLEKYFAELSKHYVAIATALVVGFTLALFLGQAQVKLGLLIVAVLVYFLLLAIALGLSYLSSKFTENRQVDEHV